MSTQDGNQWNAPENKPKGKGSDPKLPGSDGEQDVRQGARQEDQLENLKPSSAADDAEKPETPAAGDIDQDHE